MGSEIKRCTTAIAAVTSKTVSDALALVPFNGCSTYAIIHIPPSERHVPVTACAWSADGRLLATASCADSDIQLWDVDQQKCVALRRVGAPGALLSWSPNGRKLFASTVGTVFRVWSTHDWTPDRWTVPLGAVQSAAWSPCGGYLLFVTSEESYIYSLCFVEEQLFTSEYSHTAFR